MIFLSPLFSQEVSDARVALLVTLSSILGAAFTAIAKFFVNWRKTSRAEAKEDEKTIVDHLELTLERAKKDCEDCHKENKELRQQKEIEIVLKERWKGHARYLEGILRVKRIPYQSMPRDPDELPPVGIGPDSEQVRRATPPEGYPGV